MAFKTVEDAVQFGAETFDDAEEDARRIRKSFRDMRAVFETIRNAGHIGGLEANSLACECDELATSFEAHLWRLHEKLTRRAEALGIDLPQSRDGGR
jgi:hypothetical protein